MGCGRWSSSRFDGTRSTSSTAAFASAARNKDRKPCGGTSAASIFSSMRSIRMALGFIGADHPRCHGVIVLICFRGDIEFGFIGADPLIRNVLDDFLHAGFELLQFLRLEARPHDAQAIANPGADLTVDW